MAQARGAFLEKRFSVVIDKHTICSHRAHGVGSALFIYEHTGIQLVHSLRTLQVAADVVASPNVDPNVVQTCKALTSRYSTSAPVCEFSLGGIAVQFGLH